MQNIMHIATNAGHTTQNDGWTMKMRAAPCIMLAATHLVFAKDQSGDLRSPPRHQGTHSTPMLRKINLPLYSRVK